MEDATIADRPVVVLAANEAFALPLAVTVRSALDRLAADQKLTIYILDGGIAEPTKRRLLRSWPAHQVTVHWVTVDSAALADVPVSGHANRENYFRILAPWLLPSSLDRAIYLDADLLVRHDLCQLWQADLGDSVCLAVQDCAAPYFDARVATANYRWCGPHIGDVTPIANYQELGLNPRSEYFNSGVLVLDLAAWRREDIPRQLLACLAANQPHIRWWDQYALNVVLADRWKPLDPRWNQGANVYAYPSWSQSPYDRATFKQFRDHPFIIHFTTRHKPWLNSCLHPRRRTFFQTVDETDWAHWRPWHENRLRAALQIAHAQERRLRLARRRLTSQVFEAISRRVDRAA